jgi:AraC-like DNA-binding protein
MDDILIIYNEEHTNIQDTLQDFNNIHPNIQYTMETQIDNKINYLDISIEITNSTFRFNIYRKPTTTDLITPNESCHPTEHKLAAIKYLYNRKDTYPIPVEYKQEETKIISTIMHNNGYTTQTLTRNKRKQANATPTETRKWAVFTYMGKETRTITKLFRNTNIHIACKTRNTLQKHLQMKNINPDKYSQSGVYEIKCNTCLLKYIGQTGRNFRTRFKEHIHAIRTNKTTSKYAQHNLETGEIYGKIEDTFHIAKTKAH